jgi:malonyl-CoA/methylmalonyl-CoA synthetase
VAIVEAGVSFRYRDLEDAARRAAGWLLAGRGDLQEARVAFQVRPGFEWVALAWGIWKAGGVAVPLALSHPEPELERVVRDAGADAVIADPERAAALAGVARRLGARRAVTPEVLAGSPGPLPAVEPERHALIVYTSGTTGGPRGVVITHANLVAQITSLVTAWQWSPDDRVLLVLPLHHVHGIVNVLGCALWTGARCDVASPRFEAGETWTRLAFGDLTLFMAVPTIYQKLIAAWEAAPEATRRAWTDGARGLRVMVSGSAALPVATLRRWHEITGHTLLERYGMTEIGMALSNPLHGERRPGFVGTPLPGVDVRLVDDAGRAVPPGEPGELEVRGPGVFQEYWGRPDATREAFRDGWFRTGDLAVVEDGSFRLLGRTSVDILKTGGYKVSALEIEDVLRGHPAVGECAVVGLDDPEWGQRVCAAVELRPGALLTLEELQAWARERLAPYKLPRALVTVPALPRNAMGKVVKRDVAGLFAKRR